AHPKRQAPGKEYHRLIRRLGSARQVEEGGEALPTVAGIVGDFLTAPLWGRVSSFHSGVERHAVVVVHSAIEAECLLGYRPLLAVIPEDGLDGTIGRSGIGLAGGGTSQADAVAGFTI